MENKFTRFRGNKDCPKCRGKGSYQYDDMHGKICENCCTHPYGFEELPIEHYGEKKPYKICTFGCGENQEK